MQGLTAQYLTHIGVPVPRDAVVLVHPASGVGRMHTKLPTHRGGQLIATVARAHKAGVSQQGRSSIDRLRSQRL
jgi:NADPH2:quinone reductase